MTSTQRGSAFRRIVGMAALGLAPLVMIGCGGEEEPEVPAAADVGATPGGPVTPGVDSPAAPSSPSPGELGGPGVNITQAMIDQGRQVFTGVGNCYTCHGQDATGTQLAPSLTDQEWIHGDGSFDFIRNTVQSGIPNPTQFPAPMPPEGGASLTPEQVQAVSAYVYSISHPGFTPSGS